MRRRTPESTGSIRTIRDELGVPSSVEEPARSPEREQEKASLHPLPGSHDKGATHIAQLQVDSALLFERVTNTLKLLGDQYLARVSRLAAQCFHLEAWDASILRKLQTLGRN